jgi:hypothetical protein
VHEILGGRSITDQPQRKRTDALMVRVVHITHRGSVTANERVNQRRLFVHGTGNAWIRD